jgi:hypothetical protein
MEMLPPDALADEVPDDVADALDVAPAEDDELDEELLLPHAPITIAAITVSSVAANGLTYLFTDPPPRGRVPRLDNVFPSGVGCESARPGPAGP